MLSIVTAIFQFVLLACDPHETCAVTHREPGVAGTFYLYCAQTRDDGVEFIDVGHFVPDVPRSPKATP